jgi:glycosyltransferase involved in cell wall biosynthesis
MKVLYFSRDYTTHDHRFLSSLAASGVETLFLRLERRSRQLEDRALPPGVELVPWRGGRSPFAWKDLPARALELRRIVKAHKPDLVHAGSIHSGALVAALAGIHPLVSMSWGSDLLKDAFANPRMTWLTRQVLRRSDVLVGDCTAVKDAAVGFGFPAEKVVLFPWGINLESFTPPQDNVSELRARLGWQDCVVALSLRSWEPIYGLDTIIMGFARAAYEEPRLRMILLGGGSLAGMVQGLLSSYGLHDRVHVGGQVSQNDLPRYYQAADFYISASHSDGSSVSLMEALASSLPVLVSDIPGNREWISEGEQGWFFPVGDPETLKSLLLRAASQPETLAAMRPAARHLAEQRADWSKNFQKLLAAYRMATQA